MTQKPVDGRQPSEEKPSSASSSSSPRRLSRWLKIVLPVLIVALGLMAAHQTGWWASLTGPDRKSGPSEALSPTAVKTSVDDLFSSSDVLKLVGRSPADPGRVLFPSFERSVVPESGDKAKSCPPLSPGAPPSQAASSPEPAAQGPGPAPAVSPRSLPAPRPVETPVISPREPAVPEASAGKKKAASGPVRDRSDGPESRPPATGRDFPEPDDTGAPAEGKAKKTGTGVASPPLSPSTPGSEKASDQDERGKQEPFQLPGSLMVKIHNYAGTSVQWGMMVILDDSSAMASKVKPWNPTPSAAAVNLVGKLPGILTPGSKMAVRDFLCKKTGAEKRSGPCLSHVLLDWSAKPTKQLKEKLAALEPGGTNNPCAAVAFSAKKDLGELGKLVPRMLVVTRGSVKCDHKGALAALQKTGIREKISVDVIALGMSSKRQRGYATLAKKTNGVFIKADKPADIDLALARYEKILKKKTVEKVEVRGDKATFILDLSEEITIPPGSYTVVLPTVAGITTDHRTIPHVRIASGEARVLNVRIRKGKLQVRAVKK